MFIRTPIFFAPEGDGGAVATEAPPAAVETAPAPEATPAAPVTAPVTGAVTEPVTPPAEGTPAEAPDWGAKVTEWGGEDAVARALRIDKALDTPEGQEQLIVAGLQARGFNPAQIEAFLKSNEPPPGEAPESIESLLSDPDRQLTAGEIKRVLDARDQQAAQATQQQNIIASAQAVTKSVFTELSTPEINQQTILTIADQFLPQPGVIPADPQVVEAAIRRGAAEFQRQVEEAAKARIEGKAEQAAGLPSPLPAAGTGGVEQPTEPMTVAEASARVRAKHGFTH